MKAETKTGDTGQPRAKQVVASQPSFATSPSDRPGLVCTFYSYKGGVGRSMALANVAALLARWGQRVLVIDWDLEAPGLERYFGTRLGGSRRETPGLVDLIGSFDAPGVNGKPADPIDWRDCLMKASIPQGEAVHIIHAGRDCADYLTRLRAIDWDRLFKDGFGRELERMRSEWKKDYNYVLIDSRTGITDIGGICSILLPDYLVSLFTTNEQSVLGVKETMASARKQQQDLPLDRQRLVIVPIAARDESNTEYKRAEEWRKRFAVELSEFYSDWIHKDETTESVLNYLKIPYVAFWSFGEQLPVLEEDATNPKTLAYSYALIGRLIHSRLNWAEVKEGREAAEAQARQAAEMQARLAEASKARMEALAQQHAAAERRLEERRKLVLDRFEGLLAANRMRLIRIAQLLASLAVIIAAVGGICLFWDYYRSRSLLTIEWVIALVLGIPSVLGLLQGLFHRKRLAGIKHELERERAEYLAGLGRYAGLTSELALQTFGERIEHISANQNPGTGPAEAGGAQRTSAALPGPSPLPQAPMPAETILQPAASSQQSSHLDLPVPPVLDEMSAVDVFLSYPQMGISRDWALEFTPLFKRWLSEMLGREAEVFNAGSSVAPGTNWVRAVDQALSNARTAVVILSRQHFQSEAGREELEKLLRTLPVDRIFPLRLESVSTDEVPREIASIQWTDFSDVAYIGEGFAKSERYIAFQDRIRELAKRVASAIDREAQRVGARPDFR